MTKKAKKTGDRENDKPIESQDYHASLTTNITPKIAFEKISNVNEWWSLRFEGTTKIGDVFTVHFKSGDWYKIKIGTKLPNKKIEWNIIDSDQTWHEKRNEWNGTKIVWEISPVKVGSKVTMTHLGLIPEFECYNSCKKGWDYLLKESLFKYLTEGTGLPV